MTYEDPGWGEVFGRGMLRPWRASALGQGLDGVSVLRALFLVFVIALFLYLFVVFQIVEEDGDPARSWVVWGIALLGLASIAGSRWTATRPLKTSSERELANSFRTNLFIGIAFSETPALLGLALAFVESSRWLYVEGLVFSLVALWMVAPTRGQIERRQRDVTAAGSPLSLGEALSPSYPRSEP